MKYLQRRAAGICASCPARSAKSLCPRCSQRAVRAERENRRALRLQGRCVVCGAAPRSGFVRCQGCTDHQREATAKSRAGRAA